MGIAYRYTTEGGAPLKTCPGCGQDLTTHFGVVVELAVCGAVVESARALDADGFLEDTAGGAVAAGLHSATRCGRCDGRLAAMTGVVEERI